MRFSQNILFSLLFHDSSLGNEIFALVVSLYLLWNTFPVLGNYFPVKSLHTIKINGHFLSNHLQRLIKDLSLTVTENLLSISYDFLGEKLLPDGDFSGYVEKGNASTRRGSLFSNWLGTTESITWTSTSASRSYVLGICVEWTHFPSEHSLKNRRREAVFRLDKRTHFPFTRDQNIAWFSVVERTR